MSSNANGKDFSMTKEELERFEKALKNEEFRKMLVEYAEEISDPKNKKKYEEEIAQMEKMRGMDVKFVNPEDGYVVKTTVMKCGLKAFVNICSNEHIKPASSVYVEKIEDGTKKPGHQWNIPYSLSKPRDDFDRAGAKCVVYDSVFHPDTYKKGQEDERFKKLMIDTALDGIQREFKVELDRKNLKFPKMKFKGLKHPTVIRTKTADSEVSENCDKDFAIGGMKFPYPYKDEPTKQHQEDESKMKHEQVTKQKAPPSPNTPEFRVVHRGIIDFQNFTHARDSNASTRPKELVIYIDLPQLESTAPVNLDIFEKQLILDCKQPSYHLDLALPYPVDEENGTAKFDKSKKQLTVTLPLQPPPTATKMDSDQIEATEAADETAHDQLKNDVESGAHTSFLATSSAGSAEPSSSFAEESALSQKASVSESVTAGNCEAKEQSLPTEEKDEISFVDAAVEHARAEEFVDEFSNGPIDDRPTSVQNEDAAIEECNVDIKFNIPPSLLSGMSSPCFFHCPPYTYHQDNDIITFIIDVPYVALDSVSLGFNDNKAYISFPCQSSLSGHLPPPDYALYVQFPEGQNLQAELCNIDVSEDNLVLTLHKKDACKGLWDSFQAGSDEEQLETKFFVTRKTVQMMMKEIADQDPWASSTREASVKVSSVTDDCLTLELEADLGRQVIGESQENRRNSVENAAAETNMFQSDPILNETDTDQANDLRESNLRNGEGNKECNRKTRGVSLTESLSSETGTSDNEALLTAENGDSYVPIDIITNAVKTRRSILRRTSSTSTDDSYGDENEFSGIPESPGKKNVRFNLNPKVRVFSNKKDKKKKKLQARLNADAKKYSQVREGSGSEQSSGTSPVENGTGLGGFEWQCNGTVSSTRTGEVEVDKTDIDRCNASVGSSGGGTVTGLTNSLIFELD